MNLRAEMARSGLTFRQLCAYDDPERGWVDPLRDDPEVRQLVKNFMQRLWMAALEAEGKA